MVSCIEQSACASQYAMELLHWGLPPRSYTDYAGLEISVHSRVVMDTSVNGAIVNEGGPRVPVRKPLPSGLNN